MVAAFWHLFDAADELPASGEDRSFSRAKKAQAV